VKPDVLILGGGIGGLSSAWHLARAGARVVLLESEAQFGAHSSGKNAAILRTLIESPELTRLARKSAESLHRPPPGFCESPLVEANGLLLTCESQHWQQIRSWRDAAGPGTYKESESQWMTGGELRRINPHFKPASGKDHSGLYFPHQGTIDIALLLDSFARGARRAGADLRTKAAVRELVTSASGHIEGVLLASGETIRCDRVLLAAGAWAGKLASAAGSPLSFLPMRRHLAVTTARKDMHARMGIVWNHGFGEPDRTFYMRPESGGALLCGCDETLIEPATPWPESPCPKDPAALESIARATAHFAPNLADAKIATWWSGWRTFTPNGNFALGPDPTVEGLYHCTGLAGHGMTTGFEAGRLTAASLARDLKLTNAPDLDGETYEGTFTPSLQLT
jgi:glycine/D-amino acid oxidase-like deaminating enzyme